MGATTVATESTPAIPAYTASPPKTKGTNSIDTIFRHLSDEQIEIAARSSYRYLVSSTNGNASEEDRDKHAKAMIFRYLQAEQKVHPNSPSEQWEAAALDKMKKTLAFRVEKNVDDIRLCFDKTHSSSSSSSEQLQRRHATEAQTRRHPRLRSVLPPHGAFVHQPLQQRTHQDRGTSQEGHQRRTGIDQCQALADVPHGDEGSAQ
mmetsp:Transcript_11282/g.23683  ORF Transcript_11282/g.23683 Transcript_11282/m.23683 type:complete len:205 (+) Transcript_11282:123-737(+)